MVRAGQLAQRYVPQTNEGCASKLHKKGLRGGGSGSTQTNALSPENCKEVELHKCPLSLLLGGHLSQRWLLLRKCKTNWEISSNRSGLQKFQTLFLSISSLPSLSYWGGWILQAGQSGWLEKHLIGFTTKVDDHRRPYSVFTPSKVSLIDQIQCQSSWGKDNNEIQSWDRSQKTVVDTCQQTLQAMCLPVLINCWEIKINAKTYISHPWQQS